jgi:hypothetical protein
MSQIDDLKGNIDELSEIVLSLNEETKPFDVAKYFMTPRQIAKKMMQTTNPTLIDATGQPMPADEKSIHIIVYGKYMEGPDGKVVDNEIKFPDCVDLNRAMPDNHPTLKDKVPNMKKEVKNSVRMLGIKKDKLKAAVILAAKQIVLGLTVMASSAVLLPIGSGIPNAMAALQSIVVAINTLATSVLDIIPMLGPLVDIPLLILEAALTVVLGFINLLLKAIIVVLGAIDEVKKLIGPIIKLIP